MYISAFSGSHAPLRPDRAASGSRNPSGESSASAPETDHLSREIRDQRNSSVAWQILDRCVLHSSDSGDTPVSSETAASADSQTSSAPDAAVTDTAPALTPSTPGRTQQTTEMEYLGVQVHIRDVQVSDNGVQIVEADLTYEHLVLRQTPKPAPQKSDPMMLDLNGNGLETTGVANGVSFDLNADGIQDRASVATGGDALLALDRNGNGQIDDGRELFGDQNGDANGFEALRRYDDNGDGVINNSDAVYSRLRLLSWNSDGTQQLQDLASAGVDSIGLDYANTASTFENGDSVAQSGSYTRSDGSRAEIADLLLSYDTVS
ncbi:hypothetical protein E4T66_08375 [Sinimarinibacterium sp. CAU 1509]|uniref:hypothetical protein n=1 Tax=Sinimarinibacterium sp. CAU 1509 TaxID=2562283 RepID=UPI0010AC47CA|nr:hypothetical protein [Sinimarinibacterium sp. CAU 1509]TJY62229.1 hypothetical protein E4T66_08375 [Sinimarinibacterium sp. CAU 1509]